MDVCTAAHSDVSAELEELLKGEDSDIDMEEMESLYRQERQAVVNESLEKLQHGIKEAKVRGLEYQSLLTFEPCYVCQFGNMQATCYFESEVVCVCVCVYVHCQIIKALLSL